MTAHAFQTEPIGLSTRLREETREVHESAEQSPFMSRLVAGKVTRYRRNITLEPMNAYERHVIHAALQDHPDVTTFSTGTEPNRRIVVAYSRYKSAEAAVKKDFPETEEE